MPPTSFYAPSQGEPSSAFGGAAQRVGAGVKPAASGVDMGRIMELRSILKTLPPDMELDRDALLKLMTAADQGYRMKYERQTPMAVAPPTPHQQRMQELEFRETGLDVDKKQAEAGRGYLPAISPYDRQLQDLNLQREASELREREALEKGGWLPPVRPLTPEERLKADQEAIARAQAIALGSQKIAEGEDAASRGYFPRQAPPTPEDLKDKAQERALRELRISAAQKRLPLIGQPPPVRPPTPEDLEDRSLRNENVRSQIDARGAGAEQDVETELARREKQWLDSPEADVVRREAELAADRTFPFPNEDEKLSASKALQEALEGKPGPDGKPAGGLRAKWRKQMTVRAQLDREEAEARRQEKELDALIEEEKRRGR